MKFTVTVEDHTDRTFLNDVVFVNEFQRAMEPALKDVLEAMDIAAKSITDSEMRPDFISSSDPSYRESFTSDSAVVDLYFEGEFENVSGHREWVENGRPKGQKGPPYEEIYNYLEAHGDFSKVEVISPRSGNYEGDARERAIERFVWNTVRKIGRKGVPAKKIMRKLNRRFTRKTIGALLAVAFDRRFRNAG